METFINRSGARLFFAFIAGLSLVPAMSPWGLWPFMFAGFSLFYIALDRARSGREALLSGALFGFGFHLLGLWWIGNALLVPGNESYRWAWPLAVAGLPLLLSVFTAVAAVLSWRAGRLSTSAPGRFFLFTALFGLAEWLRGHILTGFPWNLYGYGWTHLWAIAQLAAPIGIYSLTTITIFWAGFPGFLTLWNASFARKALFFGLVAASFAAAYGYGVSRLAAPEKDDAEKNAVVLLLVQPNIAQAEKWDPARARENLDTLLSLSESRPGEDKPGHTTVVIWPETSIHTGFLRDEQAVAAIRRVLAGYPGPVYLMTGLLRAEKEGYYNSLVVYDRELFPLAVYNKSHLVPFGEYIPFQELFSFGPVTGFEGFSAGRGPETATVLDLPPFSPLVCYEVIFPGAVVEKGPRRPKWIVNVTNDAWYGDSPGPYQHFSTARFRALEEGVPVVRVANTGVSGVIDSKGRVVAQTDLLREERATVALPFSVEKTSLYGWIRSISFVFVLSFFFLLYFTTFGRIK